MIKALLAALVIIAGGVYYFFFHPPVVMKRATSAALDRFGEAVATKDRAKISDTLKNLLTPDAKINLEVNFFAIGNQKRPLTQDFTKDTFISFVDNTLYPLTDYNYEARLTKFSLADDRKTAQVSFTSKEWADGAQMFGGAAVNMRFSSETQCEGSVTFTEMKPQLSGAICKMQFRSVPKPGEAARLNNMEGLREMLIQQR